MTALGAKALFLPDLSLVDRSFFGVDRNSPLFGDVERLKLVRDFHTLLHLSDSELNHSAGIASSEIRKTLSAALQLWLKEKAVSVFRFEFAHDDRRHENLPNYPVRMLTLVQHVLMTIWVVVRVSIDRQEDLRSHQRLIRSPSLKPQPVFSTVL